MIDMSALYRWYHSFKEKRERRVYQKYCKKVEQYYKLKALVEELEKELEDSDELGD